MVDRMTRIRSLTEILVASFIPQASPMNLAPISQKNAKRVKGVPASEAPNLSALTLAITQTIKNLGY